MSLGAKTLVLFDLDGTLVDSVPDLHAAAGATLIDLGLAPATQADVRRWVGNGVDRLLHRALTGSMDGHADAPLHTRASALFSKHYARSNGTQATLYAGAGECLETLRAAGLRMACVTNKPQRFARELLTVMGIASAFELLLGGDALAAKKPDPLPLVHAARQLGVDRAAVLMVGDSSNDVRAARAARMAVVCVSYGYNHGLDIRDARPDLVIDSLAALPALLVAPPPATDGSARTQPSHTR